MSIDSIFLFAPAEFARAESGPAAQAIALAKEHGARLTLFVINLDVTTPGRQACAIEAAAPLRAAAESAGLDCEVVTEHTHAIGVHEVIAEHARLHDITVTGCRGGGVLSERDIAQHLLFASGRPVLLAPAGAAAPEPARGFAAAWDNTAAAARALGDAKSLVGEREITFLTIANDKELQGDLSPDRVMRAAARRGFAARAVTAERAGRPIADALQHEARALGADILVMGGYARSRVRQIVLGSATAGILGGPRMPVLLSH